MFSSCPVPIGVWGFQASNTFLDEQSVFCSVSAYHVQQQHLMLLKCCGPERHWGGVPLNSVHSCLGDTLTTKNVRPRGSKTAYFPGGTVPVGFLEKDEWGTCVYSRAKYFPVWNKICKMGFLVIKMLYAGIRKTCRCAPYGHSLVVNLEVFGLQLDSMVLRVFSNLNDSVIL